MQTNKKKSLTRVLFGLYLFLLMLVILVKDPFYFKWRMDETFRRGHLNFGTGLCANYKPFHTINHLLFVDFHFLTALMNIGGNILLFIPLGIYLSLYFKAPQKMLKIIATCCVLSTCFEIFQLLTVCGFFDVDDIFLNTLGGVVGLWIFSMFINHSKYSQKRIVVAYSPT